MEPLAITPYRRLRTEKIRPRLKTAHHTVVLPDKALCSPGSLPQPTLPDKDEKELLLSNIANHVVRSVSESGYLDCYLVDGDCHGFVIEIGA